MAIVTGPLMSMTASGTIGQTLTYGNWKQTLWCRLWVLGHFPNTAAQQVINGYFTDAVEAWQAESSTTKTLWDAYVTANELNMSGFNFYMSKYIEFLIAHSGTPPTVTNAPPTMM